MNCDICALDDSADPALWSCKGCPRRFHAACIGITLQRNSTRRNNAKVDFNSYILPCCVSCQELLLAKLELNHLYEQQKALTEQLHANTEVLHRFSRQQEKPSIVDEALEGLEIMMSAIKNELATINKTSSLAGSISTIKNHITAVLDIVTQKNNEHLTNSLKSVTSEISTGLRNINDDLCQINQLQLDLAATTTASSNPNLFIDIVDELKTWSAKLVSPKTSEPVSLETYPSLEVELIQSDKPENTSGWRLLGDKNVWKADWTSYDARKANREKQQKIAEQARKRKKRNIKIKQSHNHRINNEHKDSQRHLHRSHASNKNIINNHQRHNPITFQKNRNGSNCDTCRNHERTTVGNDFNRSNRQTVADIPLLDRELLAAAKEKFSRPPPPTPYKPTIRFQRGEVLNPYPNNGQPSHTHQTKAASNRLNGTCSCRCFCRN